MLLQTIVVYSILIDSPLIIQCLNNAFKEEGYDSSLKLPDKVLTFVRDHPLMENSVVAAPLLVRKGIQYTKLAVTHTGVGDERRGAVLHLGTGEEKRLLGNIFLSDSG